MSTDIWTKTLPCISRQFMLQYTLTRYISKGSDDVLPITFMALINNEDDKDLFKQVYDTYRTMLLGYAYKITNDVSLAEDAVSEAFLRLAKSFSDYPFPSPSPIYHNSQALKPLKSTAQAFNCPKYFPTNEK